MSKKEHDIKIRAILKVVQSIGIETDEKGTGTAQKNLSTKYRLYLPRKMKNYSTSL